jgi:hypothetical protein
MTTPEILTQNIEKPQTSESLDQDAGKFLSAATGNSPDGPLSGTAGVLADTTRENQGF